MNIKCRQDAIDRVEALMNEEFICIKSKNTISFLDIIVEMKDTEDVETLVELKTRINGILDNEIIFRLKK